METELAVATIEEWISKAEADSERVGIVVTAALQIMKCIATKDIEGLSEATTLLKERQALAFPVKTKMKNGMRYLIFGMMEALIATSQSIVASERIYYEEYDNVITDRNDPGYSGSVEAANSRVMNGQHNVKMEEDEESKEDGEKEHRKQPAAGFKHNGDGNVVQGVPEAFMNQEIKEEVEDDYEVKEEEPNGENGMEYDEINEQQAFSIEEDVKFEEEIVKEEPLCPPIIDMLQVPVSSDASSSAPIPPRATGVRFRKATKRDYADIAMAPVISSNSIPSASKRKVSSEKPADSYYSPLNEAFAKVKNGVFNEPDMPRTCNWDCDDCKKSFTDVSINMEEHIMMHQVYECGDCQLRFCLKRSINKHMKLHEIGKHKCIVPTCPSRFSNRKLRDNHIKNEHGLKPYTCEFCGMRFDSPGSWEYHKFTKHRVEYQEQCNARLLSKSKVVRVKDIKRVPEVHVKKPEDYAKQCKLDI